MAKSKEQTLEELYNVTKMIMEPEITPVLRGSCRMQGPVDETDYDIQLYTVSSQAGKGSDRCSMSRKVQLRAESGTCNVCSAPCSSCLHFNRALMGSKTEESSGETCRGNAASQYSNNEGNVLPPLTSRACDNLHQTASETSNLLSVSSSHDSLSENAESKANLRSSDTFDASEDVEMCPKLSSGGTVKEDQHPSKPWCVSDQGTLSNKYEDTRGADDHDDNVSCVSGANDTNITVDYDNRNVDRKNELCSSASVCSLGPVGFGKAINIQTGSGSSDIHCNVKESHNNCRRHYTDNSIHQVSPISLSTALIFHPSKDTDAGSSSPKVQGPLSHSGSRKSPSTCNSNLKDSEEDLSSHHCGKQPEYSIQHMNSSSVKELPSSILCGKESVVNEQADIFQNIKGSLAGGNSEVSMEICPKLEAETDRESGDQPDEALKCSDQSEQVENFNELVDLPDVQQPPLHSSSGDESDESDIVEHDVKVCDICGDAGREDLLAICSRCSDGAEHTYCMREMLDKVPEGEWLCEECKFAEETEKHKQDKVEIVDGNVKNQCSEETEKHKQDKVEIVDGNVKNQCSEETEKHKQDKVEIVDGNVKNQCSEEIEKHKQDKVEIVDGNVKNQCSGHTSDLRTDLFVKLDSKDSDVEGSRTNIVSPSTQVSRKRSAENIDVASAAKRQVLETVTASPKASSPSRTAVLSRDRSLKNLDKGKVKPAHQTSFGAHSINDISETARSPTTGSHQTPRGALLKSNSFSTLNYKPKVKLVDDVPHKQKWHREPASLDMKEGPVRMISKSMSFKSGFSGRSNAAESKVKMLSSKFSHVQDVKGLKKIKERNTSERKNLSKSDRTLVSSTMASSTVSTLKIDPKLTSRGESISLSSVSNNRDSKVVQSDGKFATSKPSGHLACKGSEIPVTLGEGKRQSSCSLNAVGASSTNAMCNSTEQKTNQVSPKDEPLSSSSRTTDRQSSNVSGILQDGLPWSRESTIQGERTGESSLTRSRQGVTAGGRNLPCQKCKEMGHATQFCTIGGPRASAVDASGARNSKEEMNKGNKLKAAIQAAMLKKPGIYKKNRVPDQSDELSMSSTDLNCEIVSQDQLSVSSCSRNMISAEGTNEGQAILPSCSSDSFKQTNVNNVKQLTVEPTEAVFTSTSGGSDFVISSDGKPTMRDLHSHASAAMSVLSRMSAIPEHEFIWQGDFEVHRSGKVLDLCGGIQAHLSTCSSPKVLEVVKKFSHKIPLNEVPRLSTWPTQFHGRGATEDNIALYFFAKDLESYERSYKILLESMMKNDLALKGNLDGVDLLIFPSNQLPEKFQRWNMLYFLWGLFRARRVNCLDHITGSSKKLDIPILNVMTLGKCIPSAVMSLSENLCSPKRIDEESTADVRPCNAVLESNAPASLKLPILSSPATANGNSDTKPSSLDQMFSGLKAKSEQQDNRLESQSLSRIPASSAPLCPELSCTSTSLKEHNDPYCKLDVELQPPIQATRMHSGSIKVEKMQMHWDTSNDGNDASSCPSNIPSVGPQEVGSVGNVGEEKILDRINSRTDQVKFEKNSKVVPGLDTKAALERDTLMGDLSMKEANSWQFSHRKRPHLDLAQPASQPSSSGTNHTMPWNDGSSLSIDGENVSKKLKTGFSGIYGSNSFRNTNASSDDFASHIQDLRPSSSSKEKKFDGACDEMDISEDSGTTERFFFPVESRPVVDLRMGDNSMPWKAISSGDVVQLHDEVPNLELALGAETKPPKQGILPPQKQGILPFFVGMADKKNNQDKPPNKVLTKEDEDDVAASLSLSLSFPFPDGERTVKPPSKTEQLLPERRHVNSLFLFEGFSDK